MSSIVDPGLVEVAHDLHEDRRAATAGRDRQLAGVLVERDIAVAILREQRHRARDGCAIAHDDLDPLATDLRLELVGGPAGDDPPVVDDGDRVGQLVGLLEVLGREQQGRALADETPDDVPHPQPAARIETGRRLVEEQQPGPADQGTRQVEPAAHAARIGLDRAIGGIGELELLEQLVTSATSLRRWQLVQPTEHPQVLATGQVLVDRRELARQADDASAAGRPA